MPKYLRRGKGNKRKIWGGKLLIPKYCLTKSKKKKIELKVKLFAKEIKPIKFLLTAKIITHTRAPVNN